MSLPTGSLPTGPRPSGSRARGLRVRFAAVAAAVALTGPALAAGTADAATTYTLKAGSAPAGTVVYANGATIGPAPQIKLRDVTSGTTATCQSATGRGYGKVGSGLSGVGLTTLEAARLKPVGCLGPLGLKLNLIASGLWKLSATGYSNGVATGVLRGVDATVRADDPAACSFRATGTVQGSYANNGQTITTKALPTLTISEVVGCFGLIADGDKATISLSLKLTPVNAAYNPLTITSP